VVASVHKLKQNPREMTRRMIEAIRNPNVKVPAVRATALLARRHPSKFDLGEVLRAAHEERCALEVNSQPDRIDVTDAACMAAR
jgi:DNA polymerase (family X)